MIFLREYSEELPTAPVTSPVPQVTVEPVEQEPSWYTGMGDALCRAHTLPTLRTSPL